MKRNKSKKSTKKFKSNFAAKVTRDNERREKAKKGGTYLDIPSGVPIFKAEPNSKIYLDILPYIVTDTNHPDKYEDEEIAVKGSLWYKRPFAIHRNIGGGNDSVVCPQSIGKACPVCDYQNKQQDQGAEWDDIKQLNASKRNLYIVVPRNSKEFEAIPHIWDMSNYLFQDLLDEELWENEAAGIFPDLENGLTLKIRFAEGKIGDNSFAEASRIDFKKRKGKGYPESILDKVPNLDEVLTILPYEKLEAKFFEIEQNSTTKEDSKYIDSDDSDEEEPWEEEKEIQKEGEFEVPKFEIDESDDDESDDDWDDDWDDDDWE